MENNFKKYEHEVQNNPILKELHFPENEKHSVYSSRVYEKTRNFFSRNCHEELEAKSDPTSKERIIYETNIADFDTLNSYILKTLTPHIIFKEGYVGRFSDDLFIELIENFELKFNKILIEKGNKQILKTDLYSKNEWNKIKEELGNNKYLTIPCKELKSKNISLRFPWSYSRSKSDYFPLYVCGATDELRHIFHFNLSLSDHLLVYKVVDGEMSLYNYENLDEVCVKYSDFTCPISRGEYSKLTQQEYNNYISRDIQKGRDFYVVDNYYKEEDSYIRVKNKTDKCISSLKIDTERNYPSNKIIWGAINKNVSSKNKALSFYSIDEDNSPVENTTIRTRISDLIKDEESYNTEKCNFLESQYNILNVSRGVNLWVSEEINTKEGKFFSSLYSMNEGSVNIKMKYHPEDNNEYLPFCIVKYVKKFTFSQMPKNKDERTKQNVILRETEN